jgi:hypothetical protein
MARVTENYAKSEDGMAKSEQDPSQVSEWLRPAHLQSKRSVSVVQQMALSDDPEKQRGRTRTSQNGENCIAVEDLIREDQRAKVLETAKVAGIAESFWI